jgi:hypothetical protein
VQLYFRKILNKESLKSSTDINIESYVTFYFNLIFSIKESTSSEEESQKLELEILEYHTRAMATLQE